MPETTLTRCRDESDTVRAVGEAVRGRFPVFRDKVYVNSCSQGALSDVVRAAYEEYLDGWDENGAEWEHWVERSEAARAAFAALLGASPDDVAIQTSVSAAVSGARQRAPVQGRAEPDRHLRERVPDDRPDRARAGAPRRGGRPGRARLPRRTRPRSTSEPRSSPRRSSPSGRARCTTSRRSTGSRASTAR